MHVTEQEENLETARRIVLDYLGAMAKRDLERAARYFVANPDIRFPGGLRPASPKEIAESTAQRYKRVTKQIEQVSTWKDDDAIGVLVHGTLYGEWLDGEKFEGVAFMDLFRVKDGLIHSQHVLNESAEFVLARRD